ncbi:MAG: orotate phosphoribosyltransferase [Blautia sp.]|uniref:Orotate phosphoribosyltransferase n=1 Tax=Blautia argi TaxID=1912897 RepID=A0A2Z4UEI2_9FIRM|nr:MULTISPECIES: orotate phosphoribosyltransferase [Blautia]AWY99493.1 orotate phosphoribosyltransferase [Blautia argi]
MEARMFKVYAKGDEKIQLKVMPGHFVTSQSHITHYLEMTTMKTRCAEAARIARLLSVRYETTTPVDSIICLDGLEVVGAFLAEELAKAGVLSMNAHKTIYIVTPEFNANGQMILRDNIQNMVRNRNTVILMGSITTGATLQQCIETVLYYGGKIQGVSAIFSAVNKVAGIDINAVFSKQDIPNYESYPAEKCPMCQRKEKIDAIVNGYGYSKL